MPARRDLLKLLAAGAPAMFGAGIWPQALLAQAGSAGLIAPNVCALTPETTEGPYYIDPDLVRGDIREGLPGVPMILRLQVVDQDCRPIPGARVDIWHCDAQGNYSGFAGQGSDANRNTVGQTFLRGTQIAGEMGDVAFRSIYPGWYRGRTTHVHFKVFLDRATLLTGQIFFPDKWSREIFAQTPSYGGRSGQAIGNDQDGIARRAGAGAFARVAIGAGGTLIASMVIGVQG